MNQYGAQIERGRIEQITGDGLCKVASISRDGIITPALPSIGGATYTVGDYVYFFMFDDGHGAILASFTV